jgi:hypothetical protein
MAILDRHLSLQSVFAGSSYGVDVCGSYARLAAIVRTIGDLAPNAGGFLSRGKRSRKPRGDIDGLVGTGDKTFQPLQGCKTIHGLVTALVEQVQRSHPDYTQRLVQILEDRFRPASHEPEVCGFRSLNVLKMQARRFSADNDRTAPARIALRQQGQPHAPGNDRVGTPDAPFEFH